MGSPLTRLPDLGQASRPTLAKFHSTRLRRRKAPASLLPETTTEQIMVALRQYRTCFINRARLIDDYKPDAMTTATSTRGSCKAEMVGMARSVADGATAETHRQIAASANRREVEAALNADHTERNQRQTRR